jgi:hypothetical protein
MTPAAAYMQVKGGIFQRYFGMDPVRRRKLRSYKRRRPPLPPSAAEGVSQRGGGAEPGSVREPTSDQLEFLPKVQQVVFLRLLGYAGGGGPAY